MGSPNPLQKLAVPAVVALICFLAYASQVLFYFVEPQPLESGQSLVFNCLVLAIFICYYRACSTEPGRVPAGFTPPVIDNEESDVREDASRQRQRWCRKCNAVKPPRAHHCKTCERCVLKMDHHCPWTANCVSHTTLPHFFRFLFYAVSTMIYLEYFLAIRARVIWDSRHLPSYLGPSAFQLVFLFIITAVNSIVLFALLILLVRTLWCLAVNTTTIEGWEIERHATLVRRARVFGGYLNGPDGSRIRIVKQEFPYDIGIYANLVQGMGGHFYTWLWPFAATPRNETGVRFPENGFEGPGTTWPPPDPDRLVRFTKAVNTSNPFTHSMDPADFRKRQEADMLRQRHSSSVSTINVERRRRFHRRFDDYDRRDSQINDRLYSGGDSPVDESEEEVTGSEGEEGWRNAEGERLADFGVEEDIEFYDEDDVPLAEIIKAKRIRRELESDAGSAQS